MLIFGEKFLEGVSLKQIHPAFPVSLPFAINGKKGLATDGERGRKGRGGRRERGVQVTIMAGKLYQDEGKEKE